MSLTSLDASNILQLDKLGFICLPFFTIKSDFSSVHKQQVPRLQVKMRRILEAESHSHSAPSIENLLREERPPAEDPSRPGPRAGQGGGGAATS